jgi:hypothetical protein
MGALLVDQRQKKAHGHNASFSFGWSMESIRSVR